MDFFSAVSAFSLDGEYWSAWEPFSEEKIFTLPPEDGEHTVHFRAIDKAGNIAEPVLSSIILETTTSTKTPASEKTTSAAEIWHIALAIILILILIIVGLIVILKRKKPEEEQLLLPEAVTIKPRALPAPTVISDHVPAAPPIPKLPGVVPTTTSQPATPTLLAKVAQTTTTPVATTTPTPIEPAAQPPQLPPATPMAQPTQVVTTSTVSTAGDDKNSNSN